MTGDTTWAQFGMSHQSRFCGSAHSEIRWQASGLPTGTGTVTEQRVFTDTEIDVSDAIVGAVYEGEQTKRNEPISRLLGPGVANSRGFRKCYRIDAPRARRGRRSVPSDLAFVAIYTSGRDLDWPDSFDDATGVFTYFGDNKRPGRELHDTDKGGNWLLRDVWEGLAIGELTRENVPPFLVFKHASARQDVEFVGLGVPGAMGVPLDDCLVALWRSTGGKPFQNYRALMTILDCGTVSRQWVADLKEGRSISGNAPLAWRSWVRTGKYKPRITLPTIEYRRPADQLPQNTSEARVIETIRRYYAANPFGFERFAAALVVMMEPGRVTDISVTRPRRDGGRDAIGTYRIGFGADPVNAEFAVEAKCVGGAVGVRDVARLISRIRHRQFGVLVTTSYVAEQAYREIKDDGHPVAILAGHDIAEALIRLGYGEPQRLQDLLRSTDDEGLDLVRLGQRDREEDEGLRVADASAPYG